MKELVRTQIQLLRKNGMGVRTIAKYTGEAMETVRYQAKKVEPVETDTELMNKIKNHEACGFCGAALQQPKGVGRKKRFCTEECRRNYWLLHRDELKKNPAAAYTKVCAYCKKTFIAYGNKKRKYCCHEHYVLDYYGAPAHELLAM